MFCLARYEAFPEFFTNTLRGYNGVIDETILMQESWSRILVDDIPAGYSHTSMNVDDEGTERNIEINNRTQLKLSFFSQPIGVLAHTTLQLSPDYILQSFECSVSSRGMSIRVTGKREEDQRFLISTFSGESKTEQTVEIPDDVVLYSPFNALAMRHLRPGQSLSIKTMDPLSLTPTRILARAEEEEMLTVGDEFIAATRMACAYHSMQFKLWVDERGRVVRQETPLGWVIESASSEKALDAVAGNHTPPDLASLKSSALLMQLISRRLPDQLNDNSTDP